MPKNKADKPIIIGTPQSLYEKGIVDVLKEESADCESIVIITGFFQESGYKILCDSLKNYLNQNKLLRIYTDGSPYNSNLSLVYKIKRRRTKTKNIYVKIYESQNIPMLHSKMFIFYNLNKIAISLGSFNITKAGFENNLETGLLFQVNKTDKNYETIEKILDNIENNARDVSNDEKNDYEKNKSKYKPKLLKRKETRRQEPIENWLKEVCVFQNKVIDDFDNPLLFKGIIQRYSKKRSDYDEEEEKKTNKAVFEFTKVVLDNKHNLTPGIMNTIFHIYANILAWTGKGRKTQLSVYLDRISKSIEVSQEKKNEIIKLSDRGKYLSLYRGVDERYEIGRQHINAIYDFLNGLCIDTNEHKLYEGYCKFVLKTEAMKPRGIGLITGIMSSLNPKVFIVCNRRTRYLAKYLNPKREFIYRKIISSPGLKSYLHFNTVLKYIAERCGVSNLRELDLVCSNIFEDANKKGESIAKGNGVRS